ncbi:DUF2500 family protein [Alginatibacterium sediminis]|uniref:DUF2500 family protein n=1 Tax=Alginatibacterium sediminis TaxID=2164068 RepID=A0A420EN80_9ALTE|nr:DUF2500 family protein [Alginatibacterium sediminis]RKF22185.1 DUF2500 family protein [Alginatibacterium sediminis]
MPGWFIGLAVIFVAFGLVHARRKQKQRQWDANQELRIVEAVLSNKQCYGQSKRDNVEHLFSKDSRQGAGPFYLFFSPAEGGETRKFEVNEQQYQSIDEGVQGQLHLQGSRLILFTNPELEIEFNSPL